MMGQRSMSKRNRGKRKTFRVKAIQVQKDTPIQSVVGPMSFAREMKEGTLKELGIMPGDDIPPELTALFSFVQDNELEFIKAYYQGKTFQETLGELHFPTSAMQWVEDNMR
jgi:hypothetical protein